MYGHERIAQINSNTICHLDVGCQKYVCCFMCVIVGLTTVDKLEVYYIDIKLQAETYYRMVCRSEPSGDVDNGQHFTL